MMAGNDTLILPDDFPIASRDTLIHFYSNNRSSVKNKVVFTQNMFCLLQHGVKEVHAATGRETIRDNEVLMLTAGSVLMSESIAAGDRYEAILIFFSNNVLSAFCARHRQHPEAPAAGSPVLKIPRDAFLDNFCQSLRLLQQTQNTGLYELKVQEILSYIHMTAPGIFRQFTARALTGTSDIKLRQVVELHAGKGLTTEELAFLCDMSVSTFKRHFAAAYQMPPQKYFTRQKMEQARLLLLQHQRPSDIYHQLGYENLSAFSNEFKKHFGFPPKQFHEKNELTEQTIERSA